MIKRVKFLRPVGNKIDLSNNERVIKLFHPYFYQLYQSGTASLAAAVIAANNRHQQGKISEVIIPSYACPDLVSAVVYSGAIPIMVDLDPLCPWMSIDEVNNKITKRTSSIIAVNFLGIPERTDILKSVCNSYNISLIEDSAQGFPVNNVSGYWNGDFNVVSFGRGKPVNLLGGGSVICPTEYLLDLLPKPAPIRSGLMSGFKYKTKIGLYNLSINPYLYSLISMLPMLNIGKTIYKPLDNIFSMSNDTLKLLNSNYNQYKSNYPYNRSLADTYYKQSWRFAINLPSHLNHRMEFPLLRYPILILDKSVRDKVYTSLKQYGASLMYKDTLLKIDRVKSDVGNPYDNFPNADNFSDSLLTLPLHKEVTNSDKLVILDVLNEALN